MNLPTAQMEEKQDVIRHEPTQRPDFGREEIGRHEDVHVRTDELLPRGGRLTLGGRRDTIAFQDVAHGLVTDDIPEIGQGADDAIIVLAIA